MKLSVIAGDIAKFPADALVTTFSKQATKKTEVDLAIDRQAGSDFRYKIPTERSLLDGSATLVAGKSFYNPTAFKNIIYVVDNLQVPLADIVSAGLRQAAVVGLVDVSLPVLRLGPMLGKVEKTPRDVIREMINGVLRLSPIWLKQVTFYVDNDEPTRRLFVAELAKVHPIH